MNIETMNHETATSSGYKIATLPKRGYALRTFDETLFIFRSVGSGWDKLFRSLIKAFNTNRHLRVIICVLPRENIKALGCS